MEIIDIFKIFFDTPSMFLLAQILARKKLFETQRVSVTLPKLLQLADQAKRDGSLTAMFFLHGYIND